MGYGIGRGGVGVQWLGKVVGLVGFSSGILTPGLGDATLIVLAASTDVGAQGPRLRREAL